MHYLEDMTEEQSQPLIQAAQPVFTCRFRRKKRMLASRDNRCTQHFAINDCPAETRVMHRVTIRGNGPF